MCFAPAILVHFLCPSLRRTDAGEDSALGRVAQGALSTWAVEQRSNHMAHLGRAREGDSQAMDEQEMSTKRGRERETSEPHVVRVRN